MKTFDEALAAVCKVDGSRDSQERQTRAQGEFMHEVFDSEILQGFADNFSRMICKMNEDEDGEADLDSDALVQIFLNGVNLGVNVGIQMEKADVEPGKLKRIARFFKSRTSR